MELSGATVLVTGAGGFIPSHLAERLVKEGCRVRAMLHYDARAHRGNLEYADPALVRQMEVIAGDVQDPHFMMEAVKGCSDVFHLAALIAIPYSYVAPASYVQTNVMGTLNVLQACRAHGVARVPVLDGDGRGAGRGGRDAAQADPGGPEAGGGAAAAAGAANRCRRTDHLAASRAA